jgi:hypothetical protein
MRFRYFFNRSPYSVNFIQLTGLICDGSLNYMPFWERYQRSEVGGRRLRARLRSEVLSLVFDNRENYIVVIPIILLAPLNFLTTTL